MNRKLLKLLMVLITLTLGCTEVLAISYGTSYVAKWKDNAQAALSINFDDNGISRLASASMLEEYGLLGTFHYITGDPRDYFLYIHAAGHEIGSHSVNHVKLTTHTAEEVWYELLESKRFIEAFTGKPCVSFCYPYGARNGDVKQAVCQLYISARGPLTYSQGGINGVGNYEMCDLTQGHLPGVYPAKFSNQEYVGRLLLNMDEVAAEGGWNIEMFHAMSLDPNTEDPNGNTTRFINQGAMRDYLEAITTISNYDLWIAPQGQVARYWLEREESTINTWTITDNIILVDLLFDGDKEIFDEPLTVVTIIPEKCLSDELTLMQDGAQLDYTVDLYEVEPIAKIIISGDVSPDATGTYIKLPDDYNDEPSYKAEGKEYYIWSTGNQYYLSPALGDCGADCWYSGGGASPIGTYHVDEPNAMGTPVAVPVAGEEVSCLLYNALPGKGVVSIVFEPIPGDLDGNGNVGMPDFAIFAVHWLEGVEE